MHNHPLHNGEKWLSYHIHFDIKQSRTEGNLTKNTTITPEGSQGLKLWEDGTKLLN